MPPTAKHAISRPAIDARVSPMPSSRSADIRKQPVDEDRFEEHRAEADLGARVGEDARKFAMTAARLNGGAASATVMLRKDEERQQRHRRARTVPSTREHPAPAEQVADDAGDGRAQHVGGERDAKQAADRDLALVASARDRRPAPSPPETRRPRPARRRSAWRPAARNRSPPRRPARRAPSPARRCSSAGSCRRSRR